MPNLIVRLDQAVGLDRVVQAMADIGYDRDDLHML